MPAIVNIATGPFPAGSTPVYTAKIVDAEGAGIPDTSLDTVTLSIVDTLSGAVINGVSETDILNTGRGTVDEFGNLTITLLPDDTSMEGVPGAAKVQRSLVIDFTYNGGDSVGRHQVNFTLLALAGP